MTPIPMLTILTVLPILGALIVLSTGRSPNLARSTAFACSILSLGLTLVLWAHFDPTSGALQFQQRHLWIAPLGVEYHVGIDGLGLLMLLLSAIVVPIGIARLLADSAPRPALLRARAAPRGLPLRNLYRPQFLPLVHLLGTRPHPRLLPHQALGRPQSSKAATQFLVYTMVGSVGLLLSFLALFLATHTFDFATLAALAQSGQLMPTVIAKLAWHRFTPRHLALLIFARSLPRLRRQSPARPLPHLAARRLLRSPHRHHHPPHRRHVEDGPLRIPPHPAPHLLPADAASSSPRCSGSPSPPSSSPPTPPSRKKTSSASSPTPPSITSACACSPSSP